MTPIGHLALTTSAYSFSGMITPRDAGKIYLSYGVIMFIVFFWATWGGGSMWIMHFIDLITWVVFFAIFFSRYRGTTGEKSLIAALIGSQILSGFSHTFDKLSLMIFGSVPEGMWQPHIFWHSPLFAIMPCLVFTPVVSRLLKIPGRLLVFASLYLGYALHILADTITYDFPIYWLWPFHDFHWSIYRSFCPPLPVELGKFGSSFVNFGTSDYNAKWSWIMYSSEPAINLILITFYYPLLLIQKLVNKFSR